MQLATEQELQLKGIILECADFDGYDIYTPDTERGIINTLDDIFRSEMGWRIKQSGLYTAAKDWFQGLCSACTVPYWNNEIEEMGFDSEDYWCQISEVFVDMITGRL